jgi:LPS export ABC transporter protein LptC
VTQKNSVTTQYDAQGKPLWTASAQRLTLRRSSKTAEMAGATCKLYSNGALAWSCRAARLLANQETQKLTLLGGVTGRSADGTRSFVASSATWDAASGQIAANQGATFDLGGVKLSGGALQVNTKDGSWSMTGQPPAARSSGQGGSSEARGAGQ